DGMRRALRLGDSPSRWKSHFWPARPEYGWHLGLVGARYRLFFPGQSSVLCVHQRHWPLTLAASLARLHEWYPRCAPGFLGKAYPQLGPLVKASPAQDRLVQARIARTRQWML